MKRILQFTPFAAIALIAGLVAFRYQHRTTPPPGLLVSDDELAAHASEMLTNAQHNEVNVANADLGNLEHAGSLVRPYSKEIAEAELVKFWAKQSGGSASDPNPSGNIVVEAPDAVQRRIGVRLQFLEAADFEATACRFAQNAEGMKVAIRK